MFWKNFVQFFILVIAITTVDYFFLHRHAIGIDDANIFLNYASHVANGEGFVYNSNGERVEGFTSMLWVLICSAFYLITAQPETWLIVFLMIVTTLTITIIYTAVNKDVQLVAGPYIAKHFFWFYSAFIICIGPSYIAWSVMSLMENGIWNLLFATQLVLILQLSGNSPFGTGKKLTFLVSGVLLILTRPEGLAWGVTFSVLVFFSFIKNKKRVTFPVLYLLLLAGSALLLTWFRLQYFGHPLPTTYYAKVSKDMLYNVVHGLKYVVNFITNFNASITLLFSAMIVLLVYFLARFRNNLRTAYVAQPVFARIAIVALVIFLGLMLPLTTGGDHFGGFRFYQHVLLLFAWGLPAIIWLYQKAVNEKDRGAMRAVSATAAVFLCLTGAASINNIKNVPKTQMDYDFFLAAEGRRIGNELNQYWSDNRPSLGVIAAGAIALAYKGETVDLMGLNNTKMGHSAGGRTGIKNHAAFNKEVFYQLQADLVLPQLMADKKEAFLEYMDLLKINNFENQAMKNIFNDSNFQQQYQPVLISKRERKPVFAFVNKEWQDKLEKDSSLSLTKINAFN
jgi:arabinofuranosyltransferase